MNKNLEQFKVLDLTLLSILAIITSVMGELLHLQLPGAGFYLSFSVLITIIAMFRWNELGALVLVVSSIPMIIIGQNSMFNDLLLYVVASSFVLITGFILGKVDKEEVLDDPFKLFGIVALAYISVSLGKGFSLLMLGESFITGSIMYLLAQLFNILMSYMALLVLKKRHGLLQDMNKYFEGQNLEEQL